MPPSGPDTIIGCASRDILDHIFLTRARKSVTWVDFKDRQPTHSLDLGCGVSVV